MPPNTTPPRASSAATATAPGHAALRARVEAGAENRPGVYRFTGPRGEVLYVGKSVHVRTRLLSYFRAPGGSRAGEIVRAAGGVAWEYVPNEFEALLRELRLIRSFRPRFNVRHRRERRFAWIRITPGAAPRMVATRSPRADGSRHFGPFPAGRRLPQVLRELAVEAGIRDCPDTVPMHFADQMDLLAPARTPACIRAELGSCPAPCAARCTTAEYGRNVEALVAFLAGSSDALRDGLADRLARAAGEREFEQAARLRDRLDRIDDLRRRVRDFGAFLRRLHFVYRVPGGPHGEARRYVVIHGRVRLALAEDEPVVRKLPSHAQEEAAGEDAAGGGAPSAACRLERLLARPDPGHLSISPDEREELFLVSRWFRDNPQELDRTEPVESLLAELRG